ncbi:unnamed protein product [Paramecium sonneborni]|uniref:Uncharacterized protein n=1 Tax=Paramecium sonneborni TaxID=65129 RepID=A0A8S1N629_9CILI|nr:unnamed protein product [Paramecium sonneborni]
MQFCEFKEFTYILANFDKISNLNQKFIFKNSIFEQNIYLLSTKLIFQNKWNHQSSNLIIQQLSLLNNHISQVSNDLNLNSLDTQLLYIYTDNLNIEGLVIERGYGFIEVCITNAQNLILINSKITQGEQFQFKGLHQYFDWQLSKVKSNYYLTSLFFLSILNIEIDGLIIIQSQSYNYPLLYYRSQDKEKKQRFERIQISNLFIDQNMLLITKLQQVAAIISIESTQETLIKFENCKFYGNILHEYLQDTLLTSALLLNINSYLGTVVINNSIFNNNLVLNSTQYNLYQKSKFKNVSQFILIQQHFRLLTYQIANLMGKKSKIRNSIY